MNAKRIVIAIVVVILSLAIALLPVISSFAAEDHGTDAHSPSMSTEERVIEKSEEDVQSVPQVDDETSTETEVVTSDAEDDALPAEEPGIFETYKMPIIVGGILLIVIIVSAISISSAKKKKSKSGKHYHKKH